MFKRHQNLRMMSRIALLSALCVVLRLQFSAWGNVQPITAIFLVSAVTFGLARGISAMAITMLVSSFLLGFGIWVPFQILSFAIIMVLWRYLFPLLANSIVLQSIVVAGLAFFYGVVIDSFMAAVFGMPWWTYVAAGASFNLAHAISTLCFYPIILMIFRRFLR